MTTHAYEMSTRPLTQPPNAYRGSRTEDHADTALSLAASPPFPSLTHPPRDPRGPVNISIVLDGDSVFTRAGLGFMVGSALGAALARGEPDIGAYAVTSFAGGAICAVASAFPVQTAWFMVLVGAKWLSTASPAPPGLPASAQTPVTIQE